MSTSENNFNVTSFYFLPHPMQFKEVVKILAVIWSITRRLKMFENQFQWVTLKVTIDNGENMSVENEVISQYFHTISELNVHVLSYFSFWLSFSLI